MLANTILAQIYPQSASKNIIIQSFEPKEATDTIVINQQGNALVTTSRALDYYAYQKVTLTIVGYYEAIKCHVYIEITEAENAEYYIEFKPLMIRENEKSTIVMNVKEKKITSILSSFSFNFENDIISDNDKFEISGNKLTTKQAPNYEIQSHYAVRIKATRHFLGRTRSVVGTYKIAVLGAEDPIEGVYIYILDNKNNEVISFAENTSIGSTIALIGIIDEDLLPPNPQSWPDKVDGYSIILQDDETKSGGYTYLSISGDKIILKKKISYNNYKQVKFKLVVTDLKHEPQVTVQEEFTIHVEDYNYPPEYKDCIGVIKINEHEPAGFLIKESLEECVIDEDEDAIFFESISAEISVERDTGKITTSKEMPNYETLNKKIVEYFFTISDGVHTLKQSLKIEIMDINDAPHFINDISTDVLLQGKKVDEDVPVGQILDEFHEWVKADDEDFGQTIKYAMELVEGLDWFVNIHDN